MKPTLENALRKLLGAVLSSVTFVADYVQFDFNGPGLTAFTTPTVNCGSATHSWGQLGYRDALCGQIGCQVESATVDDQQLTIAFEGGATFSISIRDDDYIGAEALEFSLDKDLTWVV